jgi:hypothetical protein
LDYSGATDKGVKKMSKGLNLGCGNKIKEGYLGVDINGNPDIKWDLNFGIQGQGWRIDDIWMDNSLEHLHNPIRLLEEIYLQMNQGGFLEITCPNVQWFPLLILGWFGDIHEFWNGWMARKNNRGLHYSLWTPYTLRLTLETIGFKVLETKGWYLGKQFYIKAQR